MIAFNLKILALVLIAGLGIGVYAILPIIRADEDVIILTDSSGNAPESCLPSGGLVLAQNLTDLCDVVIISPATNQILSYNGSKWINVAGSVIFNDTTVCTDLNPSGNFLVCGGGNVNLKSFIEGIGIDMSQNSTNIEINSFIDCSEVGGGLGSLNSCTDNALVLKTFIAGTGISISPTANDLTINNDGIISNNCAKGINCSGSDPATFNTDFVNGTGISITGSTSQTFTNTGVISNSCTTGVNCSGTNPSVILTDFANGTGISITGTAPQTFTNTGVTSLTSADTNTLTLSGSTGAVTITPVLQKLCSVVAAGGESSITCTLTNSAQHLWISSFASYDANTTTVYRVRFNADSGNNYAQRTSVNGGADATTGSINGIQLIPSGSAVSTPFYFDLQCENFASGLEKHCWGSRYTVTAGAANAPSRAEFQFKWANTATNISSVSIERSAGTGVLQSGNTIEVWGYS